MTAVDGIGQEDHVRLVDLLEAPDGGAVEPEALAEPVLGQPVGRDGEVLHETGEVAEPQVDDLDPFVLHEADDLGGAALLHGGLLLCDLVEQPPGARGL